MKSFAFSRNLGGLVIRHSPHYQRVSVSKDWAMLKLVGWAAITAALAILTWQALADQPLWPPILSVFLLLAVSLLAGLRLGADSAAAYAADLQRLNRVLADQNRELEDANAMLLRQLSDSHSLPTKSA